MGFSLFVSFCLSISIGYTLWYCGIHVIIVYQINLKSDIVIEEKNKQRKPSLLIAMLSLIFASNYLLVLSSSTDSRQFILAPIDFLSELAFSFDDYMFGPHITAQSSSWSILSWRHHNHWSYIYNIMFHVILILYLTWSHSHPWWFRLLLRVTKFELFFIIVEYMVFSNKSRMFHL